MRMALVGDHVEREIFGQFIDPKMSLLDSLFSSFLHFLAASPDAWTGPHWTR